MWYAQKKSSHHNRRKIKCQLKKKHLVRDPKNSSKCTCFNGDHHHLRGKKVTIKHIVSERNE